jgi:hypothetical protein
VTSTTNVQMTVTVNFAQGFVGSVMVGCATITSSGINTASVSPGGRRPDARRSPAGIGGCNGLGIGSVVPDPNNASATVFASGSGGSASLIFDVMGAGAGSGVINLQGVDTVGDTASYKAPFTATPQANTGVVTAGSASGSAGSTVNVPITLALSAGTSLDTVSFGFQVTPNPSAPAITTGILSFVDGISAPTSQVDTGAGPNIINVSWLNLSTALGGNVTLGNVVVKIPANATSGQTYTLNITGARGSFQGNAVTLTAGTNAILTSASISVARKDAAPRTASASRMTVTARNENCAGVRFASGSQSGCGGSVDVEVQPVITAAGVLEVHLAIPNGGIVDLGAMALAGAQFPDADSGTQALAPQGQFLQGHTYLVKLGNQLALVRVARIRSTVSPRLAAIPGGSSRNPTVGRNGNSDLLGSMREQQQMNNVLNNAQITIDLEWLMQQPNP